MESGMCRPNFHIKPKYNIPRKFVWWESTYFMRADGRMERYKKRRIVALRPIEALKSSWFLVATEIGVMKQKTRTRI